MEGREKWTSPNGNPLEFFFREDTSDRSVIDSVVIHDEYGLKGQRYEGWGVDVGAHIGAWAITAAVDNPYLYVIAIEAIYENVLMMQRNVKLNNLESRVKPLYRAASSSNHTVQLSYAYKGDEFAHNNRYIGNLSRDTNAIDMEKWEVQQVQGLRLTRLRRMLGEDIRIMKIDCEGCEWHFLKSPAISGVHEIKGEWHDKSQAELQTLLGSTHTIQITSGGEGLGTFQAHRNTTPKSTAFENLSDESNLSSDLSES